MKSLGEILTSARKEKKLSIQDIAQATRIEARYIKALENDKFQKLPPPTFVKGFIRNYAIQVDVPPEELIAVFRRDYSSTKNTTLEKESTSNIKQKSSIISSTGWKLVATGIIAFFGYLAFQYRALVVPPPLSITQPEANSVIVSPVIIEGKTSPDSSIMINQNTHIKPDSSGIFFTQINLSPGEYELEIKSTNRFSRTNKKTIPITIVSS